MVINWYGENCFKIQSGGITLMTDPFGSETGLTPPRFHADITLHTLTNLSDKERQSTKKQDTETISGPGEYEVKGVEVTGIPVLKESTGEIIKTLFVVVVEGVRLGFLGHLSNGLDPDEMENISAIDILFAPGGGAPYLDQELSAKTVKQIGPKIVIPTLFKTSGLKRKSGDVKEFLRELEITSPETNGAKSGGVKEKLTIRKNDLPDMMQIAVLSI